MDCLRTFPKLLLCLKLSFQIFTLPWYFYKLFLQFLYSFRAEFYDLPYKHRNKIHFIKEVQCRDDIHNSILNIILIHELMNARIPFYLKGVPNPVTLLHNHLLIILSNHIIPNLLTLLLLLLSFLFLYY